MYGSEGNFIWAPDDHWLFNMDFGYTHSALGNNSFVDPRNPTAGAANAVLIKDDTPTSTSSQNCAIYLLPGQTVTPGANGALTAYLAGMGVANPYSLPPGGQGALAAYGIPYTNYGTCNTALQIPSAVMAAFGYSYTQPGNPANGQAGVLQSVHGNENPNSPPFTIGLGAQYTFPVGGGYTLVPRIDFYYQTQMWGRIFEDPADRIAGYTVTNAQIQLNAPENAWYVQLFVKNAFNATYVTGEYLTSSSSGLFTNQFLGDPQMYGVRVGVHF
jgi:iron complex outermembrane recepter protein